VATSGPRIWRGWVWLRRGALLLAGIIIGGFLAQSSRWEAPQLIAAVDGQAVSRHGGSRIVLSHRKGEWVQTCNQACDDIALRAWPGEDLVKIGVIDAQGRSLLEEKRYVTSGLTTEVALGGEEKLTLKARR
jgi:hypothetical protein